MVTSQRQTTEKNRDKNDVEKKRKKCVKGVVSVTGVGLTERNFFELTPKGPSEATAGVEGGECKRCSPCAEGGEKPK